MRRPPRTGGAASVEQSSRRTAMIRAPRGGGRGVHLPARLSRGQGFVARPARAHAGASNESAKYCVSCATLPSRSSMMLTVGMGRSSAARISASAMCPSTRETCRLRSATASTLPARWRGGSPSISSFSSRSPRPARARRRPRTRRRRTPARHRRRPRSIRVPPWRRGSTRARRRESVHHVLSTGQSLAVGTFGVPVLSTTQPYDNVMFDKGVICGGTNLNAFVPLVEGVGPDRVETMSSSFANLVTKLARAGSGTHDLLVSVHAVGGAPYRLLKKGTRPTPTAWRRPPRDSRSRRRRGSTTTSRP